MSVRSRFNYAIESELAGRATQANSSSYALHSEQICFTIHSVLLEVILGGLTEMENFLQSQDNCERCKNVS